MEHITEYSLQINGKVDPMFPVARDHERACQDRLEWLELSPDDKVEIVHRYVQIHSWYLTTL